MKNILVEIINNQNKRITRNKTKNVFIAHICLFLLHTFYIRWFYFVQERNQLKEETIEHKFIVHRHNNVIRVTTTLQHCYNIVTTTSFMSQQRHNNVIDVTTSSFMSQNGQCSHHSSRRKVRSLYK